MESKPEKETWKVKLERNKPREETREGNQGKKPGKETREESLTRKPEKKDRKGKKETWRENLVWEPGKET